jgi:predicted transport protein
MKALDRPFTKIINGTTQFVIPVFQRDYSWTEAECEQLWSDILAIAADHNDRGHFLGSVVYVSTGDSSAGFTRWLLVDGQQRLTTLTLLLAALRDHISDSGWKGSEDGPTVKRVDAYFLKNVEEDGDRRLKLVLRGHDQATLGSLLDRHELPERASDRIRDNYEFFREKLNDADPEAVYRGVGRLVVVDVTLDRGVDDPQLIFESLNSTGMDLSQSDLIRNFILMRLPEPEQTRLYEVYWSKIENLFRGSEKTFDAFVRDFIGLRVRASKQEKADEIYFAFRRVFGGIGKEPERLDKFLQELLRFARYHAAFSVGAGAPELVKAPLARLRRLVDVPAILVMRLFECFDELHTMTAEAFAQAIALIESYVFRRAICGEQTRGYWQVFANLAYEIEPQRPLESLLVGLARERENYRFPTDSEFGRALEEREIYGMRVCFELLDRFENHGSKEPTDTSKYSIEHIMPQNEKLRSEWREMLGERWRDVHRDWVHRLGNLTLTGYNSTYSDRPFAEKKMIRGGFDESSVRLNKFVREQPVWTAAEMERRGKLLARQALAIWPPLVVDKALVDAAKQTEMRLVAKRRDVSVVPMSAAARELFDLLRARILALDSDVIELAEPRSVSYHGPAFFLEVLPRKNRLNLLLAMDFNEADDRIGIARDASGRKFFVNAVYEGGVYVPVRSRADIDEALPMIRQAWELVRG